MKALPAPKKKKKVVQPTEVWSPSMGTEPMPVAGEIAPRPEGLRCNWCGRFGCLFEPWYRNMSRGKPERYERESPNFEMLAFLERLRRPPRFYFQPWNRNEMGRFFDNNPVGCLHSRKRYRAEFGWQCLDCGEKL